MTFPNSWGALHWLTPAAILIVIGLLVIIWTYARSRGSGSLRLGLGTLKLLALLLLVVCLLEPMVRFTRPEPGANVMVVMADDSQSLQIKDRGQNETRETQLKAKLTTDNQWLRKLEDDFDLRRYQFNQRLNSVDNFQEYAANQRGSAILNGLKLISNRFANRPSAGIMLMTDGNATDADLADLATAIKSNNTINWNALPPIYPVVVGKKLPAKDISIQRVSSTLTNFEQAPITISAELRSIGYGGKRIVVQLLDQENNELDKIEVDKVKDDKPFAVRFKTRPEKAGVAFYQIKVSAIGETESSVEESPEATLVNNQRTIVVDRTGGPYRVLYLTGRPNWEYKFLRRALEKDEEINLVGLIRIAKKQPKFVFRGRQGQKSNPLFRGFDDEDTTEQADEPVFIRMDIRSEGNGEELRKGFPQDAESLFEYDAVILDDIEAKFFDQDQQTLLQQFVSRRGGGLLMLGGQESFASGKYDHTAIGDMLPIYLNRIAKDQTNQQFRMDLTREGWLQPWLRIEPTEQQERTRLAKMPSFRTFNLSQTIKPGATVLATASAEARTGGRQQLPGINNDGGSKSGKQIPALVVQEFGKGRTGALLIGDMWRWHLGSDEKNEDLLKSWRQTLRWLVADVPRRTEVKSELADPLTQRADISVDVNDEFFRPFDNADVKVSVEAPDGKTYQLQAEPTDTAGQYSTSFVSQTPGAYKATVTTVAPDGSEIEVRETGWVSQPESQEFESLSPNVEFLKLLAEKTGGEVIELDQLDRFVSTLDDRKVPITETKFSPWWHRWPIFLLALGLLVTEWGIRRWKGLP